MSMQEAELVCANCGAGNIPPATVCWLCQQDLDLEIPPVLSDSPDQIKSHSLTFSIASILLVTTLSAVFFSMLAWAPGLAILLAIMSLPALVRTGLAAQRRANLGKPIPPIRKLLWFLSSFTVTTILVAVVWFASVGTFCAVCLSVRSEAALPLSILATGAVATAILVAGSYWIRYRWRRDING